MTDTTRLAVWREGTALFELSALWQDLEELLVHPVNVLSEGGLKPRFRQWIESDIVPL